MRFLLRWTVRLLSLAFLFAIVGLAVVFGAIYYYGKDLPDYTALKNYEPPIVTRVYANNGRLIGEFAAEKRVFVPIGVVPKPLINAFIAAEDQRFYTHSGADPIGIARAAWTNISNMGSEKRLVGGSTITQQVAKNFLLTSEKSFERKIKELILSYRIEQAYSKERILELYLNEIYLGNNAYGVAAASLAYFNKSLEELTIAEMAFLGGLPQAPSRYNPVKNYKEAKRRRDYVLLRMMEDGFISKDEYEQARATEIKLAVRGKNPSVGAEYFVEEIRRELDDKYGEKKLLGAGLVVRSTLDPHLQQIADRALRTGLIDYDRRHGWRGPLTNVPIEKDWTRRLSKVERPKGHGDWPLAVVMKLDANQVEIGLADGKTGVIPMWELKWARPWQKEQRVGAEPKKPSDVLKEGDVILVEKMPKPAKPVKNAPVVGDDFYFLRQVPDVTGAIVAMDPHTGRVLAMTGGYSFWISQYNNATQAKRQPGSSFKPFVYLAGLENGFTPSTIILDAPIVIDIGGWGKYKPQNYSKEFYGPSTMRRGLELSRNLMTVRLAQRIGVDKVVEVTKRFGISDNVPPELGVSLGASETTPLKLTTAYAMLVNGGKKITPTLIDRIQDRYGKTIYKHDQRPCDGCSIAAFDNKEPPKLPDNRQRIADAANTYQIVSMLEGAVQRGTGALVAVVNKPVAGKTGTTNDVLDTWFVGFTPDFVVGVWVGFDKPTTLGALEQGGKTAAPIFRDFMLEALKDKPAIPFRVPPGLVGVRVNLDNGLPARPGDTKVIVDVFKPGTEPTPEGAQSPDGVQRDAVSNADTGNKKKFKGLGETY
ncbi:MAG: penicillin-binding protein 1A [Alphaproteobacteria bacterium]